MKLLPICNAITRLGGGKCTSAAKYPAARSVSHTQTYFTSHLQSVMSFDFASKKKSGSNCLVLIGDTLLPLCFQCCFILCCTTSAQTQPDSAKLCCLSNHPELLESFFFLTCFLTSLCVHLPQPGASAVCAKRIAEEGER